MADLENHVFSSILRALAPLVMAPPGPLPPRGPQLRGVVRVGDTHVRVVFSEDGRMTAGVAFQFALSDGGKELDIDAAIDWLRTVAAIEMPRIVSQYRRGCDSHGNVIVDAYDAGFVVGGDAMWYDHNLFGLLSILVHGGGFPWFEDVYACSGFMLCPGRKCRIYIRVTDSGESYGLQIPLALTTGHIPAGLGGSLPQELVSHVRTDLINQPSVDGHDDYGAVFDVARWVDPSV
jgi:hypothetical protein